MTAGVKVLDVVTIVTPLGVRFVDEPTGAVIRDGLEVAYERAAGPAYAETNRLGVYFFNGFPGLAAQEQGAGDDAFWDAPPATRRATVEVVDARNRFLPFRFDATVPYRDRSRRPLDLFVPACVAQHLPPLSPPSGPPKSVPLFSAASRMTPAGLAALRLELWDAKAKPAAPAAWAFVDVETTAGERLGSGLADERGRVLVPFRYPSLSVAPHAPRPLTKQHWPVRLRARYARLEARPRRPHDLCELLGQAPATLLGALPSTPLADPTLEFGRELTVRTKDHNVLLVS